MERKKTEVAEQDQAKGVSQVVDDKKGKDKDKDKPPPKGRPVEMYVRVPPDGGWGWVVVAASFTANFIIDGMLYCYGLFIPVITKDFDESPGKVSIPGSLLAGFYLMTSPITGVLANKYGFQIVTVCGALFASAVIGLSSLAMNIDYLIVTYGFLGGIGFGLIYAPCIVVVGLYFEKWRAVATGIAVCGSGIGTFALSPLNELIMAQVGWKRTFLVHGGIVLLMVICGLMFRPIKPTKVIVYVTDEEGASTAKTDDTPKKVGCCKRCCTKISELFDFSLMKSPSFDILLLSGVLSMLGYFTPFSYVKDRALSNGWNYDDTVWLISIIGISNTAGRVITGLMTRIPNLDATLISCIAITIAGVATMVSTLSMSMAYQYSYCAVYGLTTAVLASLRSIMVVDLMGLEKLNSAFAILLFVQGVASAFGSPLSGFVYYVTDSYKISFCYSGALLALSGLILIPVKKINKREKKKKLLAASA